MFLTPPEYRSRYTTSQNKSEVVTSLFLIDANKIVEKSEVIHNGLWITSDLSYCGKCSTVNTQPPLVLF